MPRETLATKALRYIADSRVRVVSANQHGIRLTVSGTGREPYRVAYGRDGSGRVFAECSCQNGSIHPVAPKCCHVLIAKLLRGEE